MPQLRGEPHGIGSHDECGWGTAVPCIHRGFSYQRSPVTGGITEEPFILLRSTTEHENGQTIPLSREGRGPSGPGVGCGFRERTHPGAARHPSEEGIFMGETGCQ